MRRYGEFDPVALRATRRRAGLTQRQLAAAIGATVVRVSRWERGAATPRPDAVARLAAALGVDVVALLPTTPDPDLRTARLRRGLTVAGLAGLSGVPASTIHHLERGMTRTTPRRHTVTALAAALGTTEAAVVDLVRRSPSSGRH